MKPRKIIQIDPICKNFLLKITMLKSLMNCGELWGAYHQGWAMMRDQEDCIFPFWLNPLDAKNYAQQHWPTLSRLNVTPALFNTNGTKLKLTATQMRHLFFSQQRLHIA